MSTGSGPIVLIEKVLICQDGTQFGLWQFSAAAFSSGKFATMTYSRSITASNRPARTALQSASWSRSLCSA